LQLALNYKIETLPPLPQRRKKEIASRVEKLIIIHGITILMKTTKG
jgi:hypothetical protein